MDVAEAIFESGSGCSSSEAPSAVPKRAKRIVTAGTYELYANPCAHRVYIETNDYHPGTLIITKDGLARLVAAAFPETSELQKFLTDLLSEPSKAPERKP